jgi:hypothetical protein
MAIAIAATAPTAIPASKPPDIFFNPLLRAPGCMGVLVSVEFGVDI